MTAYRNIQARKLTDMHAAFLVGALSAWAKNENNIFEEHAFHAQHLLDLLIELSPELGEGEGATPEPESEMYPGKPRGWIPSIDGDAT